MTRPTEVDLGAFSVSLPVSDLGASRDFYERLGFRVVGGDAEQNWLILRNGRHTLGLFEGMFDGTILTFTPGWDDEGEPVSEYTDVREIQARLRGAGIEPATGTDPDGDGPASIMLTDPDGHAILIDQHVDRP